MMALYLSILSIISMAIGLHLFIIGYRTYKKNRNRSFLILCTGFLVIAFSNLFEDFVLNIMGYEVLHAHLIRIPMFTIGMFMILYSIKINK